MRKITATKPVISYSDEACIEVVSYAKDPEKGEWKTAFHKDLRSGEVSHTVEFSDHDDHFDETSRPVPSEVEAAFLGITLAAKNLLANTLFERELGRFVAPARIVAPADQEPELALTPDHPEECEGTDFVMNEGVSSVWIKVDGFAIHLLRGSYPQAQDGGVRVIVYKAGSEDSDPIDQIQIDPESLPNDEAGTETISAARFNNHYLCSCGEQWVDAWDSACDDRCPACNKSISPYASDDGSMTSEAIEEALKAAGKKAGLFVTSGWGHIFEGIGERTVRFVFDRTKEKIIKLQIADGRLWRDATAAQLADVEDSLINANEEALEDPFAYSLTPVDELPDWAAK